MNKYSEKLGGLANRLKEETPKTPIQEVKPIPTAKKEESQLNVWIPKDLLKQVKVHGAETDLSLKEITIKALEQYLNK
jgi:predicted HicB family RNase H-like nuclease